MRFSHHFWRSKQVVVDPIIIQGPNFGKRSKGKPARTYIVKIEDTEIRKKELDRDMNIRNGWKEFDCTRK